MAGSPEFTYTDTTLQARLQGPWLVIGRLVWMLVYLVCILFLLISLPVGARSAAGLVAASSSTVPTGLFVAYLMAIDLLLILGIASISGVLFWQRSDHLVAWLLALMIITYGTTLAYSVNALVVAQPAWSDLQRALLSIGEGLALAGAYIFPDGRFVPRWTRWLALFLAIWITTAFLFPAIGPNQWPPLLLFLWRTAWLGTIVLAQVYRYFRVSSPSQQQQTKWVILGLSVSVGASLSVYLFQFLAVSVGGGVANNALTLLLLPAQKLGFLLVPLTISVSILRYRLWDVDFVINRSIVYGALTILLAVLFVSTLLIVANIFGALTGGQQSIVAVAITALVFGGLFQPVRLRVQRWVDRRIYGIKIDYRSPERKPALPVPDPTKPLEAFGEMVLIGRGASSQVYRAQHPTLGRVVAVKVLPEHLVQETEFRERFRREARMIAALKHPNIIQVYDYGEQGGYYYMVLEYIAGPSLHSYMATDGPFSLVETLKLARPISAALDYAHAQGLIHRDIKPGNILLDRVASPARNAFRPVLSDFGIAKEVGGQTSLTQSGGVVGTLTYMAPEQIQASPDADIRLDIYAFGVLLYEMLTGRPPFQSRNVGAVIIAHLHQPPPDPREYAPELPAGVVAPLNRALAKKPADRFSTAAALVTALEAAIPQEQSLIR